MRKESTDREPPTRKPIRGIFCNCCASTNGTVDSRTVVSKRITIFLFTTLPLLSVASLLTPFASRLFDHFIRPVQDRLWNREAHSVGCFEIDHKLELRRLLDG